MARTGQCTHRLGLSVRNGIGNDKRAYLKQSRAIIPAASAEDIPQAAMGIGLAVSRSIVEAHGGRLWAENGQDGGARFNVALPLSPANGEPPFATLEKLFDLVLADPVVLFIVENRDQDIEVREEILKAHGGAEFERDVG
jgi:hypothetical protein